MPSEAMSGQRRSVWLLECLWLPTSRWRWCVEAQWVWTEAGRGKEGAVLLVNLAGAVLAFCQCRTGGPFMRCSLASRVGDAATVLWLLHRPEVSLWMG